MREVLRQRDFALLWFAGLISLTGNWMLAVALPITVYELTGSATAVSGVVIANLVPSVALSSVAGVFVDRWDRRRIMVVTNLLRAPLLLLLLPVNSADQVWIVYLVVFSNAMFARFFAPAENALLPRLVGSEHLVPANALNAFNNNLALLVGPALGGLVAAWGGLNGVVLLDAASFLVAGCLIALITVSGSPEQSAAMPPTQTAVGAWASVWNEWVAGVRLVGQRQALLVIFAVVAILSVGEASFLALFPVFVADVLDGGARELGWLLSGQAAGGLAGTAVVAAVGKRWAPKSLIGWGLIGGGLLELILYTYPAIVGGIWLGIGLMVGIGVPAMAANTGGAALLQQETDDAYRGRVFGALGTTQALVMLAATAIAGPAAELLSAVVVLVALSTSSIVAGLASFRLISGVSTVQPQPGADLH